MKINEQMFGVYATGTGVSTAALYTCGTTSATNTLPSAWGNGGYSVNMRAIGGDAWYVLHELSTGTASASITATAAGATDAALGGWLPEDAIVPIDVPRGRTYFARIGDTSPATAILVMRTSDKTAGK